MESDVLLIKNMETVAKKSDIDQAVSYICQKLGIKEARNLACRIKVTNMFLEDFQRIHFRPERSESNATTIPPIFQSSRYKQSVAGDADFEGKTVILINNEKLMKASSRFYISVIIHELSHCTDYVFKLPEFQEKYGVELNNSKHNTVADAIGGYFTAYSEIRAKYWQEMYMVEVHDPANYRDIFFKPKRDLNGKVQISSEFNFDPMIDASDWYHAQHIAGKIRCWEDIFINHPIFPRCVEEAKQIERIKKIYLQKSDYHEIINDMYETWDWNLMEKKCDSLFESFYGNLNAMTNVTDE